MSTPGRRQSEHGRAQSERLPVRTPGTRRCGTRRGVTLIELVVVITIVAVVASVGARLISSTASGSQSSTQRMQLATAADSALRRMARELQAALPNSLRVTSVGSSVFIEFVPVVDAGRLRRSADSLGAGDPLNFEDAADASFDVLGPTVAAGSAVELVVQNLGSDLSDVYSGNNRRAGVVLGGGGSSVAFTPNGAFPDATASSRFFLVGTPVTFQCTPAADGTGSVVRYAGYAWAATQPTSFGAAPPAMLLSSVLACSAAYTDALVNLGLLSISLTVGQGDETARLLHQVTVDNTP